MSKGDVVHGEELRWSEHAGDGLFAYRRRRLSRAAGGRQLGCSMIEVEPNKTAFPFHYHLGNEEALYVLHGEATLRLGDRRLRLRAGDYVAFPAGETHAHQITNTSAEVFRYLMISTMLEPDAIVYPDSDKVGVIAGSAPGGSAQERVLEAFFPRSAAVHYEYGEAITSASQAPASDEVDLESRVDAEFAELKRKLGQEP